MKHIWSWFVCWWLLRKELCSYRVTYICVTWRPNERLTKKPWRHRSDCARMLFSLKLLVQERRPLSEDQCICHRQIVSSLIPSLWLLFWLLPFQIIATKYGLMLGLLQLDNLVTLISFIYAWRLFSFFSLGKLFFKYDCELKVQSVWLSGRNQTQLW